MYILERNGWKWLSYDDEKLSITTELTQYKADFLGNSYSSTVIAIISDRKKHLQFDGHFGVLWLEAIYENERNDCLSYDDMCDMQQAIIHAEENLLRIGMPFTPNYHFHGKNIANKKRRNDKLRREYDMEKLESEG